MREKLKKILKVLGPGFITGAADDDPSGIAAYSQTGAMFGYSQSWTALFSFPFMTIVQEICGRIGLATGMGLSGIIRKYYPKWILYFAVFVLFFANTINIAADLSAMAASAKLVINLPFVFWLFVLTVTTVTLEIFVSYQTYSKILKYLTFSLFAYIFAAFVVKQDWIRILKSTVLPTIYFSKEYLLNIVAILGTTISPYLFFWQADEEVEEEIMHHKIASMGRGKPHITGKDIRHLRLDTAIGMFFSNLVMFFIIVTTASTLNVNGIRTIETADQAALALRPIAGDFAFLLFALGIIGTGLLAVPILAGSASYAISESFGFKTGLNKRFSQAPTFYFVIALATLLGLIIGFLPFKPFEILYWAAILNGLCAPILLILIMRISNNKEIMN
ncbi:MAG: Nramp family divalent metal transporter, partial [Candidatus Levybacteria bacterium]|nr:Nramp family divalent metal transporter [Candidatus Levybacteria bacterium]